MGNKEKKILEEIRRLVLEKDKELRKQKDTEAVREANKEALADMTELTKAEVDKIEAEVTREIEEKYKKRKRRITLITFIVIIASSIIFYKVANKKPKQKFVENFEMNENSWRILDDFKYKRYFEDGDYVIKTGVDDWCYWDYIKLDLPEKYSVEVASTWKKGKYDTYGIILSEKNNKNYIAFSMRPNGSAAYDKHKGKKWIVNNSWTSNKAKKGNGKNQNIQRIEVDGKNFKYYINDKLFKTGNTYEYDSLSRVGLRVCDEQEVRYNSIIVKNMENDKVIFEDDFENPSTKWDPVNKFDVASVFGGGNFIIESNDEGNCNWSDIAFPLKKVKNYKIELNSTWQSGEISSFGLRLYQDKKNYLFFTLQNDGTARIAHNKNGKYYNLPSHTQTKFKGDGTTSAIQKVIVEDNEIQYFINDQLVGKRKIPSYFYVSKIGITACGRQTVSFDKLVVEEL